MGSVKRILGIAFLGLVMIFCGISTLMTPIFSFGNNKASNSVQANIENLEKYVRVLTDSETERNYENTERLDEIAEYIFQHFQESGCDDTEYQNYIADGEVYKNVICRFNGTSEETIVIGAHYDVDASNYHKEDIGVETFQGADDNASGVAGLLELTKMLGNNRADQGEETVEFIAYTLEEVPHYHTEKMGSYVHAQSLKQEKRDIKYMISLEMIGYFSDEKIQQYPVRAIKLLYPRTANFIALIGKFGKSPSLKSIKKSFISKSEIDLYTMKAPSFIAGIDRSDHWSYWQHGYEAYILTDTSYLRNPHYHKVTDTPETLDFERMGEVVNGVYGVVTKN